MGLFDKIQFQYKLPLPENLGELTAAEIQSSPFQTKSLESAMSFYKVDESGQLFVEKFDGDFEPGDPKAKSIMGRIGGFKRTKEWFEPESYTGVINFYEIYQLDENKNDYWYEANATFVSGKITEIKLAEYKITDNSDRKTREAKWKAEMAATHEFRKKWYIKYLYLPYESSVRWVFRKYNQIKQKLPPSYKVERFLTPL